MNKKHLILRKQMNKKHLPVFVKKLLSTYNTIIKFYVKKASIEIVHLSQLIE